jgi:hypothetical protein
MQNLSKADKLLLAAGALAREGRMKFSAEDLVVAAFNAFPDDFSLKGYPQFPNSNAVLTQVMGKAARLIVKGWLEKTGAKQYRLTPKGIHDLDGISGEQLSRSVHLAREEEEGLGRLLSTTAYQMYSSGERDRITFHQFCRFVGLAAGDKWQRVQGQLSATRHLVETARKLGESDSSVRIHFRNRNEAYTPEDLMRLPTVLDFMESRFTSEMREWQKNVSLS